MVEHHSRLCYSVVFRLEYNTLTLNPLGSFLAMFRLNNPYGEPLGDEELYDPLAGEFVFPEDDNVSVKSFRSLITPTEMESSSDQDGIAINMFDRARGTNSRRHQKDSGSCPPPRIGPNAKHDIFAAATPSMNGAIVLCPDNVPTGVRIGVPAGVQIGVPAGMVRVVSAALCYRFACGTIRFACGARLHDLSKTKGLVVHPPSPALLVEPDLTHVSGFLPFRTCMMSVYACCPLAIPSGSMCCFAFRGSHF
jgi:hypothetical protein